MSVRISYFVHGTTTDNEQNVSSGWNDAPLSERGIQQSKALIEKIKHRHFDAIFTSDLSRAVHSAEFTWGSTCAIISDARLRECNYGDFNGKPSAMVEPLQKRSIVTPMPNGESYEMVEQRLAAFLGYLKNNYDSKHVAIVAHKALQLALDVLLKGMTWKEAFDKDWRKTKNWQPGWEYTFQ